MKIAIKIRQNEEMDSRIEESGIDLIDYDRRREHYRIKVSSKDLKKHEDLLKDLFRLAAEEDGRLALS